MAWQFAPGGQTGDDLFEWWEPFSCNRDCYDRNHREWSDGRRALRGCTRIDLKPVRWEVDPHQIQAYMGRPFNPDAPVYQIKAPDGRVIHCDPDHPYEEFTEGCPGGWYRTPYVDSVLVYLRTRSEHGVRNQNHYLDATTDRRVLDAVYYVEREQERLFARRAELLAESYKQN